jgi:hypothetical protein
MVTNSMQTQRNGTSRRGKPRRLLRMQNIRAKNFYAATSLLALGGRSGSGGCAVLRTASVSISRNSALVFAGSRVDLQLVI